VLQHSKILRSRDEWREKATKRADVGREYRKSENRHRNVIRELKQTIETLREELDDKKKERTR
jgi:hemerythrin superfamily protein